METPATWRQMAIGPLHRRLEPGDTLSPGVSTLPLSILIPDHISHRMQMVLIHTKGQHDGRPCFVNRATQCGAAGVCELTSAAWVGVVRAGRAPVGCPRLA